jgi:hypothetical protein
MARASHHHIGEGSQGKKDGSGAMTDVDLETIPANGVLSNRDKSRHSAERGVDGKEILTEQLQDHAANRIDDSKV